MFCDGSQPAASRESFVPGAYDGRSNEKNWQGDDVDIVGSMSTKDKHYRKTSTVGFSNNHYVGVYHIVASWKNFYFEYEN